MSSPVIHPTESRRISDLTPHPQNYRAHGEEQIRHLKASITEHGMYRNVVVSNDDVILAGHGMIQAAAELGIEEVPVSVVPLPHTAPEALKLLVADNTIAGFASDDDRLLTDLLKSIATETELGLLGTGYTDEALVAHALTTRSGEELKDHGDATEWLGMPDLGDTSYTEYRILVTCYSEADRDDFVRHYGLEITMKQSPKTWSITWPIEPSLNTPIVFHTDETEIPDYFLGDA